MKNKNFKSIRAARLEVGKTYFAMIWHTWTRRELVEVKIQSVMGTKPRTGMRIVTDKFEFFNIRGGMNTNIDGKTKYVTFQVAVNPEKKEYPLVKVEADPVAKTEVKAQTKKRVRKPLTAEQKARKNALARARRAAKKEAAKA